MRLNNWTKFIITAVCFSAAIFGFMLKLPAVFRHHDKEMHSLFYFLAAAFLNILYAKRKLIWHVSIFVILYLFGVAIEFAQEFSNKFVRKRIHGRFDPEDLQWNLKGLIAFSLIWFFSMSLILIYNKATLKSDRNNSKIS